MTYTPTHLSPAFTLDTNIFIYALDVTAEPQKRSRAREIVQAAIQRDASVPLQCVNEFCHAVVKKKRLSSDEADLLTRDYLATLRVVESTAQDTPSACSLRATGHFQFWDALIVAVAARAGCTVLFSEDMQDGFQYGGLRIVNPFKLSDKSLDELLSR